MKNRKSGAGNNAMSDEYVTTYATGLIYESDEKKMRTLFS